MFVNVHHILWITVGVLFIGVIISYILGVLLGHVYPWFPYISDTGAEGPERGVLGYFLNITTVLLLVNMYIRYRQVALVESKLELSMSAYWNKIAMLFGGIACIGLNIVANFSELTEGIIHFTGAFMCMTMATVYFMIQTKISYHFINHPSEFVVTKLLFTIRLGLCFIMVIAYFLTVWYGKAACDEFTGDKLSYWTPDDGGFNYRLISTFSEWITTLSFTIYIMTFCHEFKNIECGSITVNVKSF